MNRGIVRSISAVVFALALAFAFSTGGLGCSGKKCCSANTKQCKGACSKAGLRKEKSDTKCPKKCPKKSPHAQSIADEK